MTDNFLQRLQAAATDDERNWLVTENLLNSLPLDLRQMAYAAAIPHWFDTEILAALQPDLKDRAVQLYADLQRLPFVEPFQGRGHNVHELTRRLMLAQLWQTQRNEYVKLSGRAAEYFGKQSIVIPTSPNQNLLQKILLPVAKWFLERAGSGGIPLSYDNDPDPVMEKQADVAEHEPENELDRQRMAKKLLGLIADLPDAQRETFLLREEAGMSIEEIAVATGVNAETAKSRLRYAVAKLRSGMQTTDNRGTAVW